MEDLYQILGLLPNCSFEEIKQQFRTLARIHHPDLGGDEEEFKKIRFAYEVLNDAASRAEYDKSGTVKKSDDIRNLAKENLVVIFFNLLPQIDPNQHNILEIIRGEIDKSINDMEGNKNDGNTYISKLELVKSKIRKKEDVTDANNLFASLIDNQIDTRNNIKKDTDKRIEIAKEMKKILEDYSYGFVEISSGGGFMHSGGP